jgi:hypothetical protein
MKGFSDILVEIYSLPPVWSDLFATAKRNLHRRRDEHKKSRY